MGIHEGEVTRGKSRYSGRAFAICIWVTPLPLPIGIPGGVGVAVLEIRAHVIHVDVGMICIWHPFECDMGLDGTLKSHIERVAGEFDMACQSAI